MAISYFGDKEQYVLNHYRSREIKAGHLVTNDYGSWALLSPDEYAQLRTGDIQEPLLTLLKDKGIVLDRGNFANVIDDYRRKCDYLFIGTSLHIVVPTLRCNLKCIYCHARAKSSRAKGYDMDEKTAKKTIDFIFQSPTGYITIEFQGGEPLLRFDLIKYIIEYAKEKNKSHKKELHWSVVTNLTHMTDEMFEYFKKNGVGICTSLDGPKVVHDANRQMHSKTRKWIKKIVDSYTINAMLLATRNTLPYPKEIVDEYISLGLPRIWIKPVNNLGDAEGNWKKIGMTAAEYLDFWTEAMDYIVTKNIEGVRIEENYTKIILRKILTKECVNFTDLESPCGAAIGQLAYSYNGNIHTCDEARLFEMFKLGTVDDRYSDIVTSPGACAITRASINDNPVCEMCAYKPICGLCPVCSYAETGNIISKLPNRRCEILIGMFDYIFEKLASEEKYRKVFFSWIGKE